jgi:hypothetical protein
LAIALRPTIMHTPDEINAIKACAGATLPWSIVIHFIFLMCIAAAPATSPTTLPASPDTWAFAATYRISHYLETAAQLQTLDVDHRAARLRELAADPRNGSEIFPLCRMLFEAKENGEFRRPSIGGTNFVGGAASVVRPAYADWPLEPITLRDDIPILIVRFMWMGGRPEPPIEYLDYCLEHCRWRDTRYSPVSAARIKQIVEEFITANPKFTKDDAAFLRWQCE